MLGKPDQECWQLWMWQATSVITWHDACFSWSISTYWYILLVHVKKYAASISTSLINPSREYVLATSMASKSHSFILTWNHLKIVGPLQWSTRSKIIRKNFKLLTRKFNKQICLISSNSISDKYDYLKKERSKPTHVLSSHAMKPYWRREQGKQVIYSSVIKGISAENC